MTILLIRTREGKYILLGSEKKCEEVTLPNGETISIVRTGGTQKKREFIKEIKKEAEERGITIENADKFK